MILEEFMMIKTKRALIENADFVASSALWFLISNSYEGMHFNNPLIYLHVTFLVMVPVYGRNFYE